MKGKAITDQIQHEVEVAQGDATNDVEYSSRHTFSDEVTAKEAFVRSVEKLLNVNGWSALSNFTADFALFDPVGRSKPDGPVEEGDFIRIVLPGPLPQNWVRVIHKAMQEKQAEFTVQPSADPGDDKPEKIAHFFCQSARSTFRVVLSGTTISAYEIGEHEAINNQGPQAGDRAILNTLIAEAGWLFYQKLQWKLLTDYLVHL